MSKTYRIPTTCETMEDVEKFLADRLGVANLEITIEDRDWGFGEVWEVKGMDMIYLGRLDDDIFHAER